VPVKPPTTQEEDGAIKAVNGNGDDGDLILQLSHFIPAATALSAERTKSIRTPITAPGP